MPPETDDSPTAIQQLKAPTTETDLLRTAVGTFDVRNRLWPAAGAEPIVTDGVARRRMVDDLYLEEIMEPGAGATQLMYELSNDRTLGEESTVVLHLPIFVLPGWGTEVTGQSVRQRREITFSGPDHQEVRQYWSLPNASEYLAVEYLYSRLPE